ncbi:AraC family transcriptional regulator [Paenibacillus agricola]|uniref:AraC family transcriptional regulator n=1 Tax=Paenibacillus agricola TaxID=2716264 RepID=A0ABX0JDZ0_9BACL|nr:AraC family transcriptional regulator [Paenibacillus agricola]NHN33610.1 AraC family transcriptional regulator [Paenibacillus agricola]
MVNSARAQTSDFTLEEYFAKDIQTNLHLFSMHVRHVKGTWFFPSHEHFQYEINYLIEGCQDFTINGKTYAQQAGDLLLIQPGAIHYNRSGNEKEFTYFCLHFQIDDCQLLPVLNSSSQIYYPCDSQMTNKVLPLLNRLIEFTQKTVSLQASDRMFMLSELFQLFGSIADELTSEKERKTDPKMNERLALNIAEKIENMVKNTHLHGPADEDRIGIDDIAADFGISPSYCNRIFKKHYQISPRQYLSNLILQKAKHLLMQKELSIDHVAEMIGYRELSHFSRQFKRWTGSSPACYRKSITD